MAAIRSGERPDESVWLTSDAASSCTWFGRGVEVSPFEGEFGRHVAVFYPLAEFEGLKQRLLQRGAEVIEPLRATPFERFFFREPVNGTSSR